MTAPKQSKFAYSLLHEGSLALAEVEANGIRMDVDYLNEAMSRVKAKIAKLEKRLKSHKIWSEWWKTVGQRANLEGVFEDAGNVASWPDSRD